MPVHTTLHYLFIELLCVAVAFLGAKWGGWLKVARWLESKIAAASSHPWLCFFGLIALCFAVRAALLPMDPVPRPLIHDEFSYMLAADTFVHGRLTNPVPPVPQAFETFHENIWPTYQSMYLPGTGLVLAAGKLIGLPWITVVLSTALFCALLYWAVSAWLPRGYALAVALLACVICLNWNRWFDNYFCLGIEAVAGALVFGSLPRILSRKTVLSVLPLGLGLCIFVLTRPYEGCVVSLPAVLILMWCLRPAGWGRIALLSVPPLLMLAATFAWLFYYNWRGTGHPLLFAYVTNYKRYHITGPFLFSHLQPIPNYHHESMRRFYLGWELGQHETIMSKPFWFLRKKFKIYYEVFVVGNGLLLLFGFVSLLRSRKQPQLAVCVAFLAFVLQIILMAWEPYPQYGASAAAVLFLLIAFGLYRLRNTQIAGISGRDLVRGWLLAQIVITGSIFYRHAKRDSLPLDPRYSDVDRPAVEKALLQSPGKDLCLVRYGPDHRGEEEWVFNDADLQNSPIVWARSMSAETDRQLIAAFPGRKVWVVQPESVSQRLVSYSSLPAPSSSRVSEATANGG
ncbi:hypothetical protein [Silvibacterium acidisoli]|uniref:hypothetical protein n=1 Tax=Acidobacteriaceae bacterium ZG23-2 TaxID=2883246 RepID=UPI00406BF31B